MPKDSDIDVYKRPGSKFWQVRYTDGSGQEIRRSSGTEDYEVAKRNLDKLKAGSGLMVTDLAVRFFEEHAVTDKTKMGYKSSLRAWAPFIMDLMIEDIDKLVIQKFVSQRLKEVKPGSIRNDLAFMSSLMSFACMLPGGPPVNPVLTFNKKYLKRSEERVRYLSPDQVTLLLSNISNPTYKLIVIMAIETGMRRKEILNLRMWNLSISGKSDTHKILLRHGETKGHQGRSIPMSSTLFRTLSVHLGTAKFGPFANLFDNPDTGKPYTDLRPWWPNALAAIGLPDFHFHDLRHHFASTYVQRGGRLQPLQEILGHKSSEMVQRYAHLSPGDTEREFRRLELNDING